MRTLRLNSSFPLLMIAVFLVWAPPGSSNTFSSLTWESLPQLFRFSIVAETPIFYLIKDRTEKEGYFVIDVLGITKTYEDRTLELGDGRIPKILIQNHSQEKRVSFFFYPGAGVHWKILPGKNPQELFVELYSKFEESDSVSKSQELPRPGNEPSSPEQGKGQQIQANEQMTGERRVRKLIIIDPGHGGFNKGAGSYRKIRGKYYWEKDLVLEYALKLKQLINQSPNLSALLTRSTDDYISLTDRVDFAQSNEGDLFLSIHLNDSPNPRSRTARGIEFFHWNELGSDNAADQYLEKMENDQMLPKLSQTQDTQLKSILSSMLKDALAEEERRSARLCDVMWASFKKSDYFKKYHRDPPVKSARFVVLANYAMPSILVEAGFLSNYEEASSLVSESFQWTTARCLYNGIQAFFDQEDTNFKPHYIEY